VVAQGKTENLSRAEHEIPFDPESILRRISADGRSRLSSLSAYRGVDEGSLLKQLSLHLPRLTFEENSSEVCVLREAERLAVRLANLRYEYLSLVPEGLGDNLPVRDFAVEPIADEHARPILERFHYLLSYRPNSLHFGLRRRGSSPWPVAMLSLSQFDLMNMLEALPADPDADSFMVVSRIYAFKQAPLNSISFLLARIREKLSVDSPHVRFLVTYLNPNVGFSGASYKADNWTLYGEESDTRYVYVDLDYRTDRWLVDTFGTADLRVLRTGLRERVSTSLFPLLPLKVYVRSTTNEIIPTADRFFDRWSPPGKR
jgi:hypothetical protein